MPENCGIALEHHRTGKVLDFFKLQRIGCGFYGKLHIFQRIVYSKDFFNPFSVLWYSPRCLQIPKKGQKFYGKK